MPRTHLITGGAGFIGSHLAERLLEQGDRVLVIDDLSTGSLANLEHLKNHPRLECVIGTILDHALLQDLARRADLIFHLAAVVGVKLATRSARRTIQTNTRGTERVLDVACKFKTPVLITSSSEVYGRSVTVPFQEEAELVLGPTSCSRWAYACTKALDEFHAMAYFHEKGVPVCIARLFNTVGPRQTGRYGMVLPTFVRQALLGEPLTVHGDGKQSRSFCDVADIVDGLARLADSTVAWGQIYNLGSTEEITIHRLACRVREQLGSYSDIVFVPYCEAYGVGFQDIRRRVPDLTKAHSLIGFVPRIPLSETILRIAARERATCWPAARVPL